MSPVHFYLGTHQPGWLKWSPVPLMVSDRRLRDVVNLPVAQTEWALDPGGYTQLTLESDWSSVPVPEYAVRINRYAEKIGKLDFAASQDWMCTPKTLAKTGLTVREHQWRTIDGWYDLDELKPQARIIKVLQGRNVDEYLQHIDFYRAAGIDLTQEWLVGVGSVAATQATPEIVDIFKALHRAGLKRLHLFGVKKLGFMHLRPALLEIADDEKCDTRTDSMGWAFAGRRRPPLPGCTTHINCANCPRYAMQWRAELLGEPVPAVAA